MVDPGLGQEPGHREPGVAGSDDDGVDGGHLGFLGFGWWVVSGKRSRVGWPDPAAHQLGAGQRTTTSMTTGVGLVSAS